MKRGWIRGRSVLVGWCVAWSSLQGAVLLDTMTAHHHIRVVETEGVRVLSFDRAEQSRMSVRQPLTGHFEYVDYFHLAWLWNDRITNVLMIGLGGGSAQRLWQAYHPGVRVETAEIDPVVLQVARDFFQLRETERLRVQVADGRQFLKRASERYDVVVLDAYSRNRYGSYIPSHLATQEFFQLVRDRLTTNGVVAYNVIGTVQGNRADLVGAMYRTMRSVFPQVYLFPARESWNVVLLGTRSAHPMTLPLAQRRLADLAQRRLTLPPSVPARLGVMRTAPPASASSAPVFTDDFTPIDGLLVEQREPLRAEPGKVSAEDR